MSMLPNLCISLILVLVSFLHNHYVSSLNTDKLPTNIKPNVRVNNAVLIGCAVGASLLAKRSYDGPSFSERPNLFGTHVVITGANTGLGKETAVKLAQLGASVFILCRSPDKAAAAVQDIQHRSGNKQVKFLLMNLGSRDSILKCTQELKQQIPKIDILVNNAGVMAIPQREVTSDGFESHIGVNHLGHFLLTAELFQLVRSAKQGRIVTVSSLAYLLGKIDRNDLMMAKQNAYEPWKAYGNSKLANLMFSSVLARKLQAQNSPVMTFACHPGVCRTELGRYIYDPSGIPPALLPLLAVPAAPLIYFTKSAEKGAQTQIYLSASEKIGPTDSGKFFDNSAPIQLQGEALDVKEAEWLWQESEVLIGKKFDV